MFGGRAIDASPPTDVSGGLLAYALSAPRHLLMSVEVWRMRYRRLAHYRRQRKSVEVWRMRYRRPAIY